MKLPQSRLRDKIGERVNEKDWTYSKIKWIKGDNHCAGVDGHGTGSCSNVFLFFNEGEQSTF